MPTGQSSHHLRHVCLAATVTCAVPSAFSRKIFIFAAAREYSGRWSVRSVLDAVSPMELVYAVVGVFANRWLR